MTFRGVMVALLAGTACAASLGTLCEHKVRAAAKASSAETPVVKATSSKTWSAERAVSYLDNREVWWQEWPRAQKDHGTVCISCHTNVPYAMVRPALAVALREQNQPAAEQKMFGDVEKRVNGWDQMETFYTDARNGKGKTAQSRATEAMMNAVILLSVDEQAGHLRPVTKKSLAEAWALQLTDGPDAGAWLWQDFQLSPWESTESGYQGVALLTMAITRAPGGYAAEPGTREHVAAMKSYLRRRYREQPLLNQLYVLWASATAKDLLTAEERHELLERVRGLEQKDAGWSSYSLDHVARVDESEPSTASDGYATALVTLALKDTGSAGHDAREHGLTWLRTHQEIDGRWPARSLNKDRNDQNVAALFMSDAATGYAVLALEGEK